MSLQFLSQKSWHPANKSNQKRIWIAEQEALEREEREKQKVKEVRKAAQVQKARAAAAAVSTAGTTDGTGAQHGAAEQVQFLYTVPPGLVQVATDGARERKQHRAVEEDDAVREFRRKAAGRTESQRKLERYVGRRAQETLTIKDQVDRFPVLKGAPVEGKYTETIRVQFNPLGLRLRNVRCLRCSEWGHQSGDRECKLRNVNPNDATRQRWEDPVTEINKLKRVKQELVLRRGALPLEMQEDGGEFEILQSDDDGDVFLAELSAKQQKRLLKKSKKKSNRCGSHLDPEMSCRQQLPRKIGKHKLSSMHEHKGKRKKRSRNQSYDANDS